MNNKELIVLICLLKQEVDALRSVLSEWDTDKYCYLQYVWADDLRKVIEGLEVKL